MEKTTRQNNQEKWFESLKGYSTSGLSQSSFCESQNLNNGTFAYWLKKYRLSKQLLVKEDVGFVALHPLGQEFTEEQIVLQAGQVKVSLPVTYQLEKLVSLIQNLSNPC